MDILIREMMNGDQNKCADLDASFIVDSALVLSVKDQKVSYTVEAVSSYRKSYQDDPSEEITSNDYMSYINNPNQIIFLAFAGNHLIGQVKVKRNWNEYAHLEDLHVDSRYRRHGVGRKLIAKVKKWALYKGIPGLMLETQNTNVRACKFYESLGFVIGGFDFYVYKNVQPIDETAIYWYLMLD